MKKIISTLKKIPPWGAIYISLAAILGIAIVDNRATPAMNFTLFYVLIVAFAAWAGRRRTGIAIAIASTVALTMDELNLGTSHVHAWWILTWNCGVRFGVFLVVALLVSAAKRFNEALGKRVEQRTIELEKTNAELSAQTGILKSICNSIGEGIVVADMTGKFILFTQPAKEILGLGALDVNSEDWSKRYGIFFPDKVTPFPNDQLPLVSALRGEKKENVELFIRNVHKPDGIFVNVTGRPLVGKSGEHTGGVVVFQDVTERKLSERRLAAQHAVTKILAEAELLPDAARGILQVICEALDWEVGLLWNFEQQTKMFYCVETWHRPDVDILEFESGSLETSYVAGKGLLGRVWATAKPAWISNVTLDAKFRRAPLAARVGLHSAFAFPILLGREVRSVIEFYSKEIREPDEKLLQLFTAVGSQIGQFIVRKQVEEEHKAQARVLENMVEGVTLVDEQGIICITNPALAAMFGYARGELLGKHISVLNNYPPTKNTQVVRDIFKETFSRGSWAGEVQNRRKDGTTFISQARISALEISGKRFLISVQQDITERKRLEKEILEISDREQGRIGQDLHDGLCQHLVSTAFVSNTLEKNLQVKAAPETADATKLSVLLDNAITQARNIARGLYPVNLEADGLMSALQELADSISSNSPIECHFICPETVLIRDNSIATHLYRITQEAVNNAIKHGKAKRILIELSLSEDRILLKITDNGVGIMQNNGTNGGMGLHIMNYRARVIGGSLDVISNGNGNGSGTVVVCSLPQKLF